MPKVNDTRRIRAKELLRLVTKGPDFTYDVFPLDDYKHPDKQITHDYRIWANSWVIDELIDLVPELRTERDNKS